MPPVHTKRNARSSSTKARTKTTRGVKRSSRRGGRTLAALYPAPGEYMSGTSAAEGASTSLATADTTQGEMDNDTEVQSEKETNPHFTKGMHLSRHLLRKTHTFFAVDFNVQSSQQNIHGCCDGYEWNTDAKDCVRCNPGYTGVGCSIKCFHPLFGENCQEVCVCSPLEVCDFVVGCLKNDDTSSTGLFAAETTVDKDVVYTNLSVNESTPSQETSNKNMTYRNLILRNWEPITILLLVLSCIILSVTYCQPTFIRIREFFTRLTSTLQP